jgi:diguanylate cyclase (GGDEF)-like protein
LEKILLVDDSRTVLSLISYNLEDSFPNIQIVKATSLAQTKDILKDDTNFFIALLDLNLPDAQNGEVVKYVLGFNIPVIVFSATFNKETRQKLLSYNILDYVVKSSQHSFDYLKDLISFKLNYKSCSIALVDSMKSRKRKTNLFLKRLGMNIIDIENYDSIIDMLDVNPSIKVLLISKDINGFNTIKLLQDIRQKYQKDELVIIAITSGDDLSTIEFLKNGANSFLKVPFYEEELISVILSNLQTLSLINDIKDYANKDLLSGLFNRRYLFSQAEDIFLNISRYDVAVAMLDIDFFKKINDTYGHQAGDEAIQFVSQTLLNSISKTDIVCRYGGEEFCILFKNQSLNETRDILENIREKIESTNLNLTDGGVINMTISIGFTKVKDNFQNMLNNADLALYESKNSGRNKVTSK